MESVIQAELLSFYGWWQLWVCLFAFLSLMAIWWHIGRKQGDGGQVWLALSVLCWSFSGLVDVLFANEVLSGNEELASFQLQGWRSILSLCNSLFILLALPWFRYIPGRIEPIIKSKFWILIVGLPFLFSLLPTISKMITGESIGVIGELDVYYAILTLVFLGMVLWESFAKRRLLILAWLSLLCILITFLAQVLKIQKADINPDLISAIFKTSLIMLFFALGLSWVKELAENILPHPSQLRMQWHRIQTDNGKTEQFVAVKGMPGGKDRKVPLTPAMYDLSRRFAERRRTGEGWLEIKPKSDNRSGRQYDIQDYNEIKRLLQAYLDGLFGKGSWSKNQHEQPLKDTLFELSDKRERKIRFRLPPENLQL